MVGVHENSRACVDVEDPEMQMEMEQMVEDGISLHVRRGIGEDPVLRLFRSVSTVF